jgi:5-(carboxyamino)imidazole ribonucleotide mutase
MEKIRVAIITGSDSDLPVVAAAAKVLAELGIPFSINVASAHRTPGRVRSCVRAAEKRGAEVFIAAAGMAAALPGVVAAETLLPVVGVPMEGKALAGMDALFAIAQMPPGIPVATVAVGKAGATNAAILAAQIMAVKDAGVRRKLAAYREKMAAAVTAKDEALQRDGWEAYIAAMKK